MLQELIAAYVKEEMALLAFIYCFDALNVKFNFCHHR